MTLRHLMIFSALCANKCNTTKTAENLHMSQPAISLAIKELESYYGVVLFDRIGRRLVLTEAGKSFLQYAERILLLFDDLETRMKNWDSIGVLRVASSITIGSQFMPEYIRIFNSLHPNIEIQVTILPSDQLEALVLNNELDLALVEGEPQNEMLVYKEYMDDYLLPVCSKNGPFKINETVSINDFVKQKFLLREKGSGTREEFDRALGSKGITVKPLWEAMSTAALVNAVSSGLGISVLPKRMIKEAIEKGRLVPFKVEGLEFHRSFYIIHHKEKFVNKTMEEFIELCLNYELDYPLPKYM